MDPTAQAKGAAYRIVGAAHYCDATIVFGPNQRGASAAAPRGNRIILYDPEIMPTLPYKKEFVIAHECGHHALEHTSPLGSLREDSPFKTKELNADCWAASALATAGRQDIIRDQIEMFLAQSEPVSGSRYPTYRERAEKLEECSSK